MNKDIINKFIFYVPIFDRIGCKPITLKLLLNPRGIIFGLKLAKIKKWKRNK